MPTIRLFDDDAYLKEATAKVISCEKELKNDKELYACILDKTIFFPEEGGQSCDKGTIDCIDVIDVQEKDGTIIHYLEKSLNDSCEVNLVLDWNHRFSNMQNHSGEHIFTSRVIKYFGFNNVGFHLSDNSVTMDFDGVLSDDDLKMIETEVNKIIFENVKITANYVDNETLKTLEYRSKKELKGPVRIVDIEGYDVCACCAPHVKHTGEIGMLKVVHSMSYKGGVRVNILCGMRALDYYRESLELIDSLTSYLTTGRENLIKQTMKLREDNYALTGELMTAKKTLLETELSAISDDEKNVFIFKDNLDSNMMKNAINTLKERHHGVIGIFSGTDEDGYSYMISSDEIDIKDIQKILTDKFQAKGGGKDVICGKLVASKDDISSALNKVY